MGQMTFALMLGCKMPKAPTGKRWWGDSEKVGEEWVYQGGLLEMFKPGRGGMGPGTDDPATTLGFFVAVAASGEQGVPSLEGPIDVAAIAADKRYTKAIERARKSYAAFAVFLGEHGVALPEARLYLVETEVA